MDKYVLIEFVDGKMKELCNTMAHDEQDAKATFMAIFALWGGYEIVTRPDSIDFTVESKWQFKRWFTVRTE